MEMINNNNPFEAVLEEEIKTETDEEIKIIDEKGEEIIINTEEHCVEISSLFFQYGSEKILDNLNMTINYGNIYSLLGPSGCGKTTLLKIILVGRYYPGKGNILVFEQIPGSRNSRVPGTSIGYSPQDNSLYPRLNIEETLFFHGRLHKMPRDHIELRIDELIEFLELPQRNKLINTCSGGEKKRISLAIALIHKPILLLLDEPTVGTDPVLRKKIWKYIEKLCLEGITVLLTTHYVQEAINSHKVGLLRSMHLLAEEEPKKLVKDYHCDDLEQVFFQLCQQIDNQNNGVVNDNKNEEIKSTQLNQPILTSIATSSQKENDHHIYHLNLPSWHLPSIWGWFWHSIAIFFRNLAMFSHDSITIIFSILLPGFQIFLYIIAIGEFTNLTIDIINQDIGIIVEGDNINLANNMIQVLENDNTFKINFPESFDEGINRVIDLKSWGVITYPPTFSQTWLNDFYNLPDPSVIGQLVSNLDFSNQQIALTIVNNLNQDFAITYQEITGNSFINPILISQPVYGTTEPEFVQFLTPGIMVIIIFIFSLLLMTMTMVNERASGTLDRIYAAGVSPISLIIGNILAYSVIVLIQISSIFLVAFVIFNLDLLGNVISLYLVGFMLAMVAMLMGIFISSFSKSEFEAQQIAMAFFFPSLLLSGIIWPVQGIVEWLRWIAYIFPTFYAAEAFRDVVNRGLGLGDIEIWISVLVDIAYSIFFLGLALYTLRPTIKQ